MACSECTGSLPLGVIKGRSLPAGSTDMRPSLGGCQAAAEVTGTGVARGAAEPALSPPCLRKME